MGSQQGAFTVPDTGGENIWLAFPRSRPSSGYMGMPSSTPASQGGRGAPHLDTHLEAGDSEAASII